MKTKFWTICIQKAQYLTKTSGIPLFMQGLDGEVLPCLQQNFFCVYCPILCKSFLWVLNIITGWPEQASEMASEHVADTF